MGRDGLVNMVVQLDKLGFEPRRVGRLAWESRCPAHRGSDHSLSLIGITRDENREVVLQCRSPQNCSYVKIARAVYFSNAEVYAETPDFLISRIFSAPIQPSLYEGSPTGEEKGPGPGAVDGASGTAGAALPRERHPDAEPIKSDGSTEPARASLEPRHEAAPQAKIPPEGGTPTADFAAEAGRSSGSEQADCLAWETSPRPADAPLEYRLQAAAEAAIPPEGGIGTDECTSEADRYERYLGPDPLDSFVRPPTPVCTSGPAGGAWPVEEVLADPEGLIAVEAPLSDQYRDKLERMSAVSLLSHLASSAGLLRSADGRFCAQVPVGDRLEIYKLKSAAFRDWLIEGYMRCRPEPPSGWAISRVVGMLEARARFKTGIPDVYIRVGQTGGELAYDVDLGDPTGQAFAVDAGGWRLMGCSKIRPCPMPCSSPPGPSRV
jgi:hypothetical protein